MLNQLETLFAEGLDQEIQAAVFQDLQDLKRSGSGYTAYCPFHDDSMPTLLIYGERPMYFCFACGEQGDWIEYLLKRKKAETFEQALHQLEEKLAMHIHISEETWRTDLTYTETLETVQNLCIAQLWSDKDLPERTYLSRRGYTQEEIEGMGLGAFPGMESIMKNLTGSMPEPMIKSVVGRMQAPCAGKSTITIPYRDSAGRLMGIYGRSVMEGQGETHYWPITDMERLQNIPFLMYRSRGCEDVVVVDGFMDALLADRIGIKGVIGVGRQGLTPEFLETAVFYGARRFMLSLSSDDATAQAIEHIMGGGLEAAVVNRPQKYADTDAYIRDTCINKFGKLLEMTIPGRDWLMSRSKTQP